MWQRLGWTILGCMASTAALSAASDDALELNDLIARTLSSARVPLPQQAETFVIAHLAMFDAANAVDGSRYTAFSAPSAAPENASSGAAALGAVCGVLLAHLSEHRAAVEKECNAVVAKIGAGPSTASVQYGENIARAIIIAGKQDAVANSYRPFTSPGVYVPTVFPAGWDARTRKPFALRVASQFRPGPPPALSSSTWARDYDETKRVGGRASKERTDEQTRAARFWSPPGAAIFNPLIRQAAAAAGPSLTDHARVFALAYIAAADAVIAVMDAKYEYNLWRPVTAIRNGDIDGNDATERDAEWLPLLETPMHPEYPCAHCIVSAAVGEVLTQVLGSGALPTPLTMRAPGVQEANAPTRSWTRVSDFVGEVSNSRIWGGIHFRNSTEVGVTMGRQVGRYVLETALKPRSP